MTPTATSTRRFYEGTLGDFTSHESLLRSTGGATASTLTPRAGDAYYLVLPLNAAYEGSYGADCFGAERPASLSPCRPQQVASCS